MELESNFRLLYNRATLTGFGLFQGRNLRPPYRAANKNPAPSARPHGQYEGVHHAPSGRFFEARLLDNQEDANTERYHTFPESSRRDVSKADRFGTDTIANNVETSGADNRPRGEWYATSYTIPTCCTPHIVQKIGGIATNHSTAVIQRKPSASSLHVGHCLAACFVYRAATV